MNTSALRALWLACVLLLSSITGIGGGVLAWLGGDNPARAVIAGAATFAATTGLAILVLTFVGSAPEPPRRTRR
jgi:hypothetical protein